MNEDKILKKLNNHDKQFKSIEKKLGDHDKDFVRIDKKFDEVDKHFADVDKKLDKHQVILENLAAKALQHDGEFVKVRQEITDTRDQILSAIDAYAKKTNDVEIEQLSTGVMLIRHEDDIAKIKKVVKIA